MRVYHKMVELEPLVVNGSILFTEDVRINFDFNEFEIAIESTHNIHFLHSCVANYIRTDKNLEFGGSLTLKNHVYVGESLTVGSSLKIIKGDLLVKGSVKVCYDLEVNGKKKSSTQNFVGMI